MATEAPKRTGLGRRTLLDDLTSGLVELIQEGGYQIGDRLPAMPALAERFGVATPTVREAARRLEAAGALTFRHGSGLFLTGDTRRLVIANPTRAGLDDAAILQVLDARLLIEPVLAGRAARVITQQQVSHLEETLDSVAQAIDARDEATVTHLNMGFHVDIARAAGNQVLAEALHSVVELYEPHQAVIGQIYDDVQHDHVEHQEILAVIAAGDSDRATELMRQHLEQIITVVDARLSSGSA